MFYNTFIKFDKKKLRGNDSGAVGDDSGMNGNNSVAVDKQPRTGVFGGYRTN